MIKGMTPKEILIATLRCEDIGYIPISPLSINRFEWTNGFPAYRRIIDSLNRHGTPLVKVPVESAPFYCAPQVTRYASTTRNEGDVKIITSTLQTPKGELTSVAKHDPKVGGGSAHLKFFIETEEDIEKALSLASVPAFLPDPAPVLAKIHEVGEQGFVSVNGIRSPFLIFADAFKYDFFLEFAFTDPERLRALIDIGYRKVEAVLTHLLDAGIRQAYRWYNIEGYTVPMLPPSWAREWIVPFDKKLMALVHQAGGFVDNHCHGQLRDQTGSFLEMGSDCVNCVEPRPANDLSLAEFKSATHNKVCVWGTVQWEDLERKSADEIRRMTRESIEMSGGKGFILSPAASAYAGEISACMEENILALIEEGVQCNADLGNEPVRQPAAAAGLPR